MKKIVSIDLVNDSIKHDGISSIDLILDGEKYFEAVSVDKITWFDSKTYGTNPHFDYLNQIKALSGNSYNISFMSGLKLFLLDYSKILTNISIVKDDEDSTLSRMMIFKTLEEYFHDFEFRLVSTFSKTTEKVDKGFSSNIEAGYVIKDAGDFIGDAFKGIQVPFRFKEFYKEKGAIKSAKPETSDIKFMVDVRKNGSIYSECENYVPEIDETFILQLDEHKDVLKAMAQGGFRKILLTGDSGLGKSETIQQLHARLNLPLQRIDFSGDILPEEFLWGTNFDPESKTLVTKKGILPYCLEKGISVVFEEFSSIPPSTAFVLQRFMEKGELYIKDTGELIKPHPAFKLFLTDNRIGNRNYQKYAGTVNQNASMIDRISYCVEFTYPSIEFEKEILTNAYPQLQDLNVEVGGEMTTLNLFDVYLSMVGSIRNQYTMGELPFSISTRSVRKFMDNLIINDGELFKTFRTTTLNFIADETLSHTLEGIFQTMIGKDAKVHLTGGTCVKEVSASEQDVINFFKGLK